MSALQDASTLKAKAGPKQGGLLVASSCVFNSCRSIGFKPVDLSDAMPLFLPSPQSASAK
jgi:hypothetical protein